MFGNWWYECVHVDPRENGYGDHEKMRKVVIQRTYKYNSIFKFIANIFKIELNEKLQHMELSCDQSLLTIRDSQTGNKFETGERQFYRELAEHWLFLKGEIKF